MMEASNVPPPTPPDQQPPTPEQAPPVPGASVTPPEQPPTPEQAPPLDDAAQVQEQLRQQLAEVRQERAALEQARAELEQERAIVDLPAAERADRAAVEARKTAPYYCPGCGRSYKYPGECMGQELPHPPIQTVSTKELDGEDHTAAPASE